MFIGIGLFNLFNLLYHFFMVRTLPPVDYGQLNTLMALFMIITVPASTVQTTITKFVSSLQAQHKYHELNGLLRHLLLLMSIVAFFLFLLVIMGRPFIASFFQISSSRLIYLIGVVLLLALVTPVPWGGLQGFQKFGLLGFNLVLNGMLKLVLGMFFIYLGWGLLGAVGALAGAYLITTSLSLLMLWTQLPGAEAMVQQEQDSGGYDLSHILETYRYFIPAGITQLCFMLLTNIDLILVKHLFTPVEAGYYSIAQMVGKVILFLPLPVVMVMFPRVSLLEAQKKDTLSVLRRSLVLAGLICGIGMVFCLLFPSFIIHMLTGKTYPECIPLVRLFSINMMIFSLTLILLHYQLSCRMTRFLYPLIFLTLIEIGAIILFHNTLLQVLLTMGMVGIFLLGINFFLVYRPGMERKYQTNGEE